MISSLSESIRMCGGRTAGSWDTPSYIFAPFVLQVVNEKEEVVEDGRRQQQQQQHYFVDIHIRGQRFTPYHGRKWIVRIAVPAEAEALDDDGNVSTHQFNQINKVVVAQSPIPSMIHRGQCFSNISDVLHHIAAAMHKKLSLSDESEIRQKMTSNANMSIQNIIFEEVLSNSCVPAKSRNMRFLITQANLTGLRDVQLHELCVTVKLCFMRVAPNYDVQDKIFSFLLGDMYMPNSLSVWLS
eukprot:PhM_4_TR10325/c0_g1_i1/m.20027